MTAADDIDHVDPEQELEDVTRAWVSQGWRVESQMSGQVVLVGGRRINHLLHLFLTVFTLGLWGVMWIIIGATGGEKRMVLTIDSRTRRVAKRKL